MAAIAVVNVLLTYAVARRSPAPGMRCSPRCSWQRLPCVIVGRMAMDYLGQCRSCSVALVSVAIDTGSGRCAFGAGLLLAAGFFSYVAAWFMMPVYFAADAGGALVGAAENTTDACGHGWFLALLLPFAMGERPR
jgi:hypothetical protein